jgi:DNA-binding MarR family transcriptional regulator
MNAAKRLLRERLIRARFFPHLGEPAWLMLVDLAANADRKVSVTSACLASFAPPTTALRHVGELEERGLVRRVPDPEDRRRVWLRLTYDARELLAAFFAEIADDAGCDHAHRDRFAPVPVLHSAISSLKGQHDVM